MKKEKIVKILIEEFLNTNFKEYKSYKAYKQFSKIDKVFKNTLTKEQLEIYLECEESFWKYINIREEEIIAFVVDFYISFFSPQ